MTTDRPNSALSAAVDQALWVLQVEGKDAAVAHLQLHGAPFALICRVLADPARRRTLAAKPLADRIGRAATGSAAGIDRAAR